MSIVLSDLISDSLREIGVLDETESASAEQGADGLRKLNQLMELWEEAGIRLDYFPQTALSSVAPIPIYAEIGVTAALAILLAPTYSAKVSPELAAIATSSYETIVKKAVIDRLPVATMQNRAVGEGDHRRVGNIIQGLP